MSYVSYQQDEVPNNCNRGVLVNQLVLPGHLVVYGFSVYSSNAGSQFALVFDNATLPGDTAVPSVTPLDLPSKQLRGVSWGTNGREFQSGFAICSSSTDTTKTLNGTADCFFDVQYDLISDGTGVNVEAES